MTISFSGRLDRTALVDAVVALRPLVTAPEVVSAWDREASLPGMSVGGVARHLVSQPECAVEFLGLEVPPGVPTLDLLAYADRLDWLDAPRDAPENTSIRDDFDEMAAAGPGESAAVLDAAIRTLPAAIADAGPVTFVPWQGCALATDDFLAMRLLEIAVHADDLAVSAGLPTPELPEPAIEPAITLLAALALRRHPQAAVIRTLARAERSPESISAF